MAGRAIDPEQIWQNILTARAAGLGVKINTVLRRGVNDSETLALAGRCRAHGLTLRFIEYMDVGQSNHWQADDVVRGATVLGRLHDRWPLAPVADQPAADTARRYRYRDGAAEVGFVNTTLHP